MTFSELENGTRFRCQLPDERGTRAIVDCVKLSRYRFRRLDSGQYIKTTSTGFPVATIPKPREPPAD